MDERYRDRYGNLLSSPRERISAKPEQTENPSKINADYYAKLWRLNGNKFTVTQEARVHNLVSGKWMTQIDYELRTMEYDDNSDFSLDEAIGVAVIASLIDYKHTLSKIRVYKYYYRFYDVVPFLLLMKYPILKYLGVLQALVWVFTLIPCYFNGTGDTSGRCLAYLKCVGLRSTLLERACEKVMSWKGTSFKDNYGYYYGYFDVSAGVQVRISYTDHPVNELWRRDE